MSLERGDPPVNVGQARIVFIAAMGFEDRALEYPRRLAATASKGTVISFRYVHAKGENRVGEFQALFAANKDWDLREVKYSSLRAHEFESSFDRMLQRNSVSENDLVVVDISAMSKFLIIVTLLRLWQIRASVRVVMTTALKYTPTKDEFEATMQTHGSSIRAFAGQPSSGVSAILRSNCMTSTRMQGQPTCAVAFTSFNEELIRHAVGTLNPRRLILINGMPPSASNAWRSEATQAIHSKLVDEYAVDNPVDPDSGLLARTASTLDYAETLDVLENVHTSYGLRERMIYFATGSKMQAVALAILKRRHADVHVEYPTPDSYYFQEYSREVGDVYWVDLSR